jgi:hypothetical protein
MTSRSHRKFLKRIDKTISFKERAAVGQYIRKLDLNECKFEDVPENIRALIHVEKPAEVALEEAADMVLAEHMPDGTEPEVPEEVLAPLEHVHSEHCDHHSPSEHEHS